MTFIKNGLLLFVIAFIVASAIKIILGFSDMKYSFILRVSFFILFCYLLSELWGIVEWCIVEKKRYARTRK